MWQTWRRGNPCCSAARKRCEGPDPPHLGRWMSLVIFSFNSIHGSQKNFSLNTNFWLPGATRMCRPRGRPCISFPKDGADAGPRPQSDGNWSTGSPFPYRFCCWEWSKSNWRVGEMLNTDTEYITKSPRGGEKRRLNIIEHAKKWGLEVNASDVLVPGWEDDRDLSWNEGIPGARQRRWWMHLPKNMLR